MKSYEKKPAILPLHRQSWVVVLIREEEEERKQAGDVK
jgi:hypothetical protein